MTYSCAIFPTLNTDLLTDQGNGLSEGRTVAGQRVSGISSKDFNPSVDIFDSMTVSSSQSLRDYAFTSVEFESSEHATRYTPFLLSGPESINLATSPVICSTRSLKGELNNGDYTPTLIDSPGSPVDTQAPGIGQAVGSGCPEKDELYLAQMRKLDHIIKKADIRPGHRVSGVLAAIPFFAYFSPRIDMTDLGAGDRIRLGFYGLAYSANNPGHYGGYNNAVYAATPICPAAHSGRPSSRWQSERSTDF